MRVKAKLLFGYGIVIAIAIILSLFAIYALRSVSSEYTDLLSHSQERLRNILTVDINVVDSRRIATGINAYCGNPERLNVYKADGEKVAESVKTEIASYIGLVENDIELTDMQKDELTAKANDLEAIFDAYKTKLIDKSIADGMKNDKEAILTDAANNAHLIASLSETVNELVEYEDRFMDSLTLKVEKNVRLHQIIFACFMVAMVLISVATALIMASAITKPLKVMGYFTNAVSKTGNLHFDEAKRAEADKIALGKDEIAVALDGFIAVMKQFIYYGECLDKVSSKDLTSDIHILGEKDTCGTALRRMQAILRDMLHDIRSASDQVAVGAKQLATSSQSLAAGSSEQASTVGVFTENVSDLRDKAVKNTEITRMTFNEVKDIEEKMASCIASMESMLSAMQDISEKSQAISKVMKVIDDIAFQTNILSLNASVEAARAGVHGKGFAVVADEVRNLASKSAEAAKETALLIDASSRSVTEGGTIVENVSNGLRSVAEISERNAKSIELLHSESEKQSKQMDEIAYMIKQLSGTIRENSAMAEASAASSEEMSNQSVVLDNIIKTFRIDDGVLKLV
ncbi:MAG: methyl-accepting chemotaxis protein [Clostridiales Family XIII bacterium]|jgi:methyl-accepting chemotaxis protein|nr:methyl-accepting chemotaxis protein [Clostridiales Family XIII bacterium]